MNLELSDEALTEARRIRDLLLGAGATQQPETMRATVREASAVAAALIERLEQIIAVEHERLRQWRRSSRRNPNNNF